MSTAPASVDGEAGAVVYFPWQPAQEKEGTAVDINALNGPKMTEGQIQTYLARLGIREEVPRTLEGLARIQLAHKIAVPFENLDIVAGRPLSLDLNHLYDKIVVRRQGGVCAELNTLYNWLLYSMSFAVTSYNARMLSPPTYLFRRHRILAVELEGKTYTTDVGFATENARVPLELTEGKVQSDGHCEYRYQWEPFFGWVQSQRRPGCDWERIQAFALEPQIDRDFDPVLFFFEKSPESNMNEFPRPSVYTPEGMLALRRHTFRVERQGLVVSSTPVTPAEEIRLSREVFHLDTTGL